MSADMSAVCPAILQRGGKGPAAAARFRVKFFPSLFALCCCRGRTQREWQTPHHRMFWSFPGAPLLSAVSHFTGGCMDCCMSGRGTFLRRQEHGLVVPVRRLHAVRGSSAILRCRVRAYSGLFI
jgi:hypothetical protein